MIKIEPCPYCGQECQVVGSGWVICKCGYSSIRAGNRAAAVRLHNKLSKMTLVTTSKESENNAQADE